MPFPAPGPGVSYFNPGPVPAGSQSFSSSFGGVAPNGNWMLFAADFADGNGGAIADGWTLELNTGSARTLSIDDLEGVEGNGNFFTQWRFPVTFLGSELLPGETLKVDYATADGTATAGSDYLAVSGTLVFTSNLPRTQFIDVSVLGDTVGEPDEFFRVNLSNLIGPVTLLRSSALGVIDSDDPVENFSGIEGDVVDANGSPVGDRLILANDIIAVRQFVVGNSSPATTFNQFQRADVNLVEGSPCGNGVLDAGDVTVLRQLVLGSFSSAVACGPTVPTP